MPDFTIDDVRESFTKDMGAFIEQIRSASRGIAERGLALSGPLDKARAALERVADAGHTITGTSALIEVASMSNTARIVEELVGKALGAIGEIEAQALRVQRIAGLCQDGSQALRAMLDHELGGARAEALAVAERFEGEVLSSTVSTPPSRPPTTRPGARPKDDEFDFSDAPAGGAADAGAAGPGEDLVEVFRQEARDAVVTLQGYLQHLSSQPDDLAATTQVERLYHTLKGAAAAVGLAAVQRLALSLQTRMEDVLAGGRVVDAAFLATLVADTNQMLEAAGVPLLAPLADARRAPEALGARRFFAAEASELIDDARGLLERLATASAARAKEIRGELGRLFHRLKGSALLVDERAIAKVAADLQAACQGRSASATQIDLGLANLEGMLGRMVVPPPTQAVARPLPAPSSEGPSPTPVPAAPAVEPRPASAAPVREKVHFVGGAELWESFELECAEIFDQIERALPRLADSDRPKAELEALMRLFHTLKGALNTVGLTPVGRLVHLVEDFLETALERPILPPMKHVEALLGDVLIGLRKNLGQAREGYVDTAPDRLAAGLAALLLGERASLRRRPAESSSASSSSSAGSDDGGSSEIEGDIERRFLRVSIDRLDALMNLAGELVVSRSRLLARILALRGLQGELVRSRRRLVDTVERFRGMYEFAWLDGRRAAPAVEASRSEAWGAFGDLELDRYDDVHVLARSLAEIANDASEIDEQVLRELAAFGYDSDAFSGIVAGIQSEVTRSRMVPLGAMFTRLRLTARDAAEREGKAVRVETIGEEVSLDKTMADALFAPLLHLVRNAVGHGVEASARRVELGKPDVGLVRLEARQESGQIVIEVTDDGAGLDLAALHARGVELGLVRPTVPLDDPAVAELVFARGLSTKAVAGDVSGRGVGGDVVRRAVERLNGTIRVSTVAGRATTFRVTVPLTLAITRAILVSVAGRAYAVPLYFADRILAPGEVPIVASAGLRRLQHEGDYLPLHGLDALLGVGAAAEGPILVLRVGAQRLAVQVDAVLGQEEIVVKGLGELLSGHPLFAGMTIRGNGELVLILDVLDLVEARAKEASGAHLPDTDQDTPAPRADRAEAPRAEAARVEALTPASIRVLFADDSLSVRKVAERALATLGYQVVTVVDGAEALERLRAERFDIVFTDLEMPRMHGYELMRELRFVPAYQDAPIVVVSSRSGDKHQAQARAMGATDYLTKPFTAEGLDAAIRRWTALGRGGGRG